MKAEVKLLLYVLAAVAAIGLFVGGKRFYDHYQDMKTKIAAAEGIQQSTGTVSDAATTASQTADSVTQHVVETRVEYRTKYEELKREDPEVAQWADGRIPLRVRRIQCERRAARDGLDSVQGGCSRFDAEAGGRR